MKVVVLETPLVASSTPLMNLEKALVILGTALVDFLVESQVVLA